MGKLFKMSGLIHSGTLPGKVPVSNFPIFWSLDVFILYDNIQKAVILAFLFRLLLSTILILQSHSGRIKFEFSIC